MKPGTLMLWQPRVGSSDPDPEWGIYIVLGLDPFDASKTLMLFVSSLTQGVTVRSFGSASPPLTVLQHPPALL